MARIAILGGGLVGRLMAWRLAQQSLSVTLFDKGSRAGGTQPRILRLLCFTPLAESIETTPLVIQLGHKVYRCGAR